MFKLVLRAGICPGNIPKGKGDQFISNKVHMGESIFYIYNKLSRLEDFCGSFPYFSSLLCAFRFLFDINLQAYAIVKDLERQIKCEN